MFGQKENLFYVHPTCSVREAAGVRKEMVLLDLCWCSAAVSVSVKSCVGIENRMCHIHSTALVSYMPRLNWESLSTHVGIAQLGDLLLVQQLSSLGLIPKLTTLAK